MTRRVQWVVATVLILAICGPQLVGSLATNLAALRLRDQLLHPGKGDQSLWASALVRDDLRLRWAVVRGGRWPMEEVVNRASGHRYAAAVAAGAWIAASAPVRHRDDDAVRWRTRASIPPSGLAAVMQRAAETLADTDPLAATELAVRAAYAQQAQSIEPQEPQLNASPTLIAAEAVRRVAFEVGPAPVMNADFALWAPPGARIPGWEAGRADIPMIIKTVDGRRGLELCAADTIESLVTSTTFRPEAGFHYRIEALVRTSRARPTIQVGVRFTEPDSQVTIGAYAFSGDAPPEWSLGTIRWQARRNATTARMVIAVAGGGCAAVTALKVTLVGRNDQ
jgi:hypothetical protein